MESCFALVDANNFYVSCERLFQPKLRDRPVIVLSNNDGCAIARSNEAKAVGVEMGAPLFEIRSLIKRHQITVLSANFALYGDISKRIYAILNASCPDVIPYSIDESFLDLSSLCVHTNIQHFSEMLVKKIYRYVGIPVTIGVGSTKTLSKVANKYAKKHRLPSHVYILQNSYSDGLLNTLSVDDIWGIGRRWAKRLNQVGIQTALDLKNSDSVQIKKKFNVVLAKTVNELNGVSCMTVEPMDVKKKSIMVSRSFGEKQREFQPIFRALSTYTSIAAEKLRKQGCVAGQIDVFLQTNLISQNQEKYANSISVKLPFPTADTIELISYAKEGLQSIYRKGFLYKKVGAVLMGLQENAHIQFDIFNEKPIQQTDRLMEVIDDVNKKFGRESLQLLAQGFAKEWKMKQEKLSNISLSKHNFLPIVIC